MPARRARGPGTPTGASTRRRSPIDAWLFAGAGYAGVLVTLASSPDDDGVDDPRHGDADRRHAPARAGDALRLSPVCPLDGDGPAGPGALHRGLSLAGPGPDLPADGARIPGADPAQRGDPAVGLGAGLGRPAGRPAVGASVHPHGGRRGRPGGALRPPGRPPGWRAAVLARRCEGRAPVGAPLGRDRARGRRRLADDALERSRSSSWRSSREDAPRAARHGARAAGARPRAGGDDHAPAGRLRRPARPDARASRSGSGRPTGRGRGCSTRSSGTRSGDTYAAWGGAAGPHARGRGRDGRRRARRDGHASPRAAARCLGRPRRSGRSRATPRWASCSARRPTRPTATGSRRRRPRRSWSAWTRAWRPSLASVATPWRAGEMLRAVWAWDQLRVYRDTILVAQVTDATPAPRRPRGVHRPAGRRGGRGRDHRLPRGRGAAGVARRRPRSRRPPARAGPAGVVRRSRSPTWRRWAGPIGSPPSSGTG